MFLTKFSRRLLLKPQFNFVNPRSFSTIAEQKAKILKQFDAQQVQQYREDTVIQVDEQDNVIGSMSKVDAHLRVLLENEMLPHRAFSLFLFNLNFSLGLFSLLCNLDYYVTCLFSIRLMILREV